MKINLKENELRLIQIALQEKIERILEKQYAFNEAGTDEEKEYIALNGKVTNALEHTDAEE